MLLSRGSVHLMVVLYSINVFITFSLSQLGMVRHWWQAGGEKWKRKLAINGVGLALTGFILLSVVVLKFHEGGWVTLLVTGGLALAAVAIRRHYNSVARMIKKLDVMMEEAAIRKSMPSTVPVRPAGISEDPYARTAVILVNGYNGIGLHTLFNIMRTMGDVTGNYFFVQVGVVDAGNFKGAEEVDRLRAHINEDIGKYVSLMKSVGFHADGIGLLSVDVVDKIAELVPELMARYPRATFFGGQLVLPKESIATRFLHNYITFAVQRRLFRDGIPFVIVPVRL
jgi:K+ transporter